jgi:hypothetical protein
VVACLAGLELDEVEQPVAVIVDSVDDPPTGADTASFPASVSAATATPRITIDIQPKRI